MDGACKILFPSVYVSYDLCRLTYLTNLLTSFLFFLQVYPIGKIRQPKMMSARLKKVIKRINEKHLLVAKKHHLTNYALIQVIYQINII